MAKQKGHQEEIKECLEEFKVSVGFKYLIEQLRKTQVELQSFTMETTPMTPDGQNNILHYQAMHGAIDLFIEKFDDIIKGDINAITEV